MSYLKSEQYYSDLYDRHTVERCRDLIRLYSEPMKDPPLIDGKEPSKKMVEIMSKMAIEYRLMFEKGDRYVKKEENIEKWIAGARSKNELYESATAPEDIRCLTCRNLMNLLDKDLRTGGLNEPDRVLFTFDCPNGCLPRRAFYDTCEEWKPKPNPCPKCGTELTIENADTKKKFISRSLCQSCGYKQTDEIDRLTLVGEEPDPDFAKDRERFCLSKEEGERYAREKVSLEQIGPFLERWKKKEKNKELYDAVAKIRKLTIIELEKLLIPALEKAGYIKFQLSNPEIDKDVIVPFGAHDSRSERTDRASEYDLKRLFKKTLQDTNWRLMSDGIMYRLGFLSGRLRGYEREEDLLELVRAQENKLAKSMKE